MDKKTAGFLISTALLSMAECAGWYIQEKAAIMFFVLFALETVAAAVTIFGFFHKGLLWSLGSTAIQMAVLFLLLPDTEGMGSSMEQSGYIFSVPIMMCIASLFGILVRKRIGAEE